MGNRLCITPTKFEDVRSGEVSLGWRAYDDYFTDYDNTWDAIPDSDLDFFQKVLSEGFDGDAHTDALESALENKGGLYLGDTWYTLEQLKPALEKFERWKEYLDGL